MKFLKALVICMVISLPFIYGFTSYTKGTWKLAQKVTSLGQLPIEVRESSGIERADQPGTFFTHNDHGASPQIFKINQTGKLLKTYTIGGATNKDWEDLTRDENGNLYIADTGNNNGQRTDLKIYKVSLNNPGQAQIINFNYDDKPAAGGKKKKGNKTAESFDSEAIFWNKNHLYLVTKDRNHSGEARLYELPDAPGTYTAKLIGNQTINNQITSAALSPDGNRLVLLSTGKLHVFKVSGSDFFKNAPETISLGNVGQTEGVVFTDNNTLIFTNEGGQIFQYSF